MDTQSHDGLEMRANDGTRMFSDIYLPPGNSPVPLILMRSPYDRTSVLSQKMIDIDECLDRGYGVVIQDTRGRFASEGTFDPFHQEMADGYETVEWLAGQKFAAGPVFMAGSSYVGATQWLAAITSPPHLAGIAPTLTSSDYHEGWIYQGGAFQLAFNLFWALVHLLPEQKRRRLGDAPEPEPVTPTYKDKKDDTSFAATAGHSLDVAGPWLEALPLTSVEPLYEDAPFYADWLWNSRPDDPYWLRISPERHAHKVQCPVLSVSGWHMLFARGSYVGHRAIRAGGGSEAARRRSRLVVGPWENSLPGPLNTKAGDVDFGPDAGIEFTALQLDFFDSILDRRPAPIEQPVRYFAMGENRWHDSLDWPPPDAAWQTFHLRAGGRLSLESPGGDEGYDETVYDPGDPVPTLGGATVPGIPQGPRDHSSLDGRADGAVYRSEPLETAVDIAGPVRAVIDADRSTPSSDITVTLSEERPDGSVMIICDGITRWDRGPKSARVEVDLLATAVRMAAGSRIHVRVSHSNFPRFDRNLGTGEPFPLGSATQTVSPRIHHSRDRGSYIVAAVRGAGA